MAEQAVRTEITEITEITEERPAAPIMEVTDKKMKFGNFKIGR